MNHSFEPNAEFVLFSGHPVLGTIMSLAALEDLAPDQEVVLYSTSVYWVHYTVQYACGGGWVCVCVCGCGC